MVHWPRAVNETGKPEVAVASNKTSPSTCAGGIVRKKMVCERFWCKFCDAAVLLAVLTLGTTGTGAGAA